MITIKQLIKNKEEDSILIDNGDKTYTEYIDVKTVKKLIVKFTNLHLDNVIKEHSEHLFRCYLDKENPMNYVEWLKQYKIRNKLN